MYFTLPVFFHPFTLMFIDCSSDHFALIYFRSNFFGWSGKVGELTTHMYQKILKRQRYSNFYSLLRFKLSLYSLSHSSHNATNGVILILSHKWNCLSTSLGKTQAFSIMRLTVFNFDTLLFCCGAICSRNNDVCAYVQAHTVHATVHLQCYWVF